VRPIDRGQIPGETTRVRRFRSKDAFARLNGTAPLSVWQSNKQRHRLSRNGNRQLNVPSAHFCIGVSPVPEARMDQGLSLLWRGLCKRSAETRPRWSCGMQRAMSSRELIISF
jgi:hypothetical protein